MLRISEHQKYYPFQHDPHSALTAHLSDWSVPCLPIYFRANENSVCVHVQLNADQIHVENSYYIGLDWIRPWNLPVLIEPKVNTEKKQLDHVGMLLEALTEPENFAHLEGLMEIKFEEDWIAVDSKTNIQLTPFLLAQFLAAVQVIVRKGLKKDYYRVTENLNARVKGKIVVSQQIRQNIVRNKLTHTVCSYQEFGVDTEVNRFLKHVLQFARTQLACFGADTFKEPLQEKLRYNLGAFQQVNQQSFTQFKGAEHNPFYKEYNVAIRLGNQLLRLLDHDISKATAPLQKYPPHWIDMSKLFELYVYKKLREQFTGAGEVLYHEKVHYQEPDFLIRSTQLNAVVDAKYKPRYKNGNPSMEDARQLSGYARLTKVYQKLAVPANEIIPVYIVYPSALKENEDLIENGSVEEAFDDETTDDNLTLFKETKMYRKSSAYQEMYLQELDLKIK